MNNTSVMIAIIIISLILLGGMVIYAVNNPDLHEGVNMNCGFKIVCGDLTEGWQSWNYANLTRKDLEEVENSSYYYGCTLNIKEDGCKE